MRGHDGSKKAFASYTITHQRPRSTVRYCELVMNNNNNRNHHIPIHHSAARRRSLYSPVVESSSVGAGSFDEQQQSPAVVVTMDDSSSTNSSGNNSISGGGDYTMHNVKDNNINSNSSNKKDNSRPSWFVIQVTAIASLGGILFGYDLGVISGALPQLIVYFDLSTHQQQLVVSILYIGGGFGAAIGGSLCDTFGRKRAILFTDIIFLLGAIILMLAHTVECILFGRVVVGFAVAVSGIADVSYLHEIAPVQWRGAIVSVNEACISLGFLLAFAIGCLLASDNDNDNDNNNNNSGWRIMFGASGIVALIQFLGMYNMPESPTWLKENGQFEESLQALQRIHHASTNTNTTTSSSSSLEQYQQPPQLEMMGGTSFIKKDDVTTLAHDGDGDTISNKIQEVEVSSSSHGLPRQPRSDKRRIVMYDSLTANDEDVMNSTTQNAPLSSAEAATAATAVAVAHIRVSSSSSDNSLTPFCAASNVVASSSSLHGPAATTTSGTTARRERGRRHPLSSSSSSSFFFIGGGLYIVWGRLVQACRQVMFLLVQIKSFIVSTMNTYRQQAYIALFLSITQQLCGQTNVLSYAPLIFANLLVKNNDNETDNDNDDAQTTMSSSSSSLASMQAWATLSIGVVKFVVTVLVIWKIEALGRRFLLLTGMFTIAMGLLLLTIAFGGGAHVAHQQGDDDEVDSGSSAQQQQQSGMNDGEQVVVVVVEDHHLGGFYLAVPGVLLVVCGYSMSFGPLTWLLTSELFPTDIRGRALGASTIVTYSAAAFVTSTFLSSQEWLGGTSAVFAVYLVVTVIGFLFAFMAIPDTKEKSVQEIQDDLNAMMWWRTMTSAAAAASRAQHYHAQNESFTGIGGGGGQQQQTQPHGRQHTGDGTMSQDEERDMILT